MDSGVIMQKIKITICPNYFDRSNRIDHEVDYVDGLSVDSLLGSIFPQNMPVIASVNGKVIKGKDYLLSPGEQVLFIPALADGGKLSDRLFNPFSSGHDPWEAIKGVIGAYNNGGSVWDQSMDAARRSIQGIPGVGGVADWHEGWARNNPEIVKLGLGIMAVAGGWWGKAGAFVLNYAANRYGIFPSGQSPSVPHVPGASPTVSSPGGGGGGGGGGGDGFTQSNSYSWNPATLQQVGATVPKIYGVFPAKGNVISANVSIVEKGSHPGDQLLNSLILLCQGPISGFSDIKINKKDLYDFGYTDSTGGRNTNVVVSYRYGDVTQSVIPNFNDTYRPYSTYSNKLVYNENSYYTTTGNDFDALKVTVTFPNGLYFIKPVSTQLHYEDIIVNWPNPDGTTTPTVIGQKYLGSTTSGGDTVSAEVKFKIYYRIENQTWVLHSTQTVTEKKTSSFSKDFKIDNLVRGNKYEIALCRITADSVATGLSDHIHWAGLTEIIKDDFTYPRCVLVGVEALATNQLSGALDFSCKVTGSLVMVYSTPTTATVIWSDNPAWVALDILTQPVINRHGDGSVTIDRYDGVDPAYIDIASFITWANFCDQLVPNGSGGWEKRFVFNGIFDSATSAWDAVIEVCAMSRAMVYIKGYKYYVTIDTIATPVQMFTSGNIIADSFEETFLSLNNRASEIEVDFCNEDNDYKRETVSIVDPNCARPKQLVTMQLIGCTNITQAWRIARYRLYNNQYITRYIKFAAEIDAIAVNIGELIYFAHDLPQWGYSGRIVSATSTTVTLDRDVLMSNGISYSVRVRLSDDSVAFKSFTAVAGIFTGSITGDTLAITAVISGVPVVGCTISGTGVTNGTRIEEILSDVGDVWTYRVSVAQTVPSTTISIATWNTLTVTAFSTIPSEFDVYTFGTTGIEYKPFRVTLIQANPDLTFTIEGVEYNATIFNCDTDEPALPTPNYSDLKAVQPVTNIQLDEIVTKNQDGVIVNNIDVYWDVPSNFSWLYAEVWYKSASLSGYTFAGRSYTDRLRIANLPLSGGPEIYTILISSANSIGQKLPFGACPTKDINVVGMADPPSNVTIFSANQIDQEIRMDWTHIEDADLAGYEIRIGNAWDTGMVIGSGITDDYFYYRPELDGTYEFFICAIDTTSHYSAIPKSVICTVANITPTLNIIYQHDFMTTPASGVAYNFTYGTGLTTCSGANALQLNTSGYGGSGDDDSFILTQDGGNLLNQDSGGIYLTSSGSGSVSRTAYFYTNTIDMLKTGTKTVRLIDNIDATEDATDLTFPDRTDMTYPDDTDLHISGEYFKYPSFRYSDGTGFTDSVPQPYFGPVTVNGRYFQFREDIVIPSQTALLAMCNFTTIIDVPEVKYKLKEVTIAAGGTTITFADYGLIFYDTPLVQATVIDATVALVPTISSKTNTSCVIKLLNVSDAGVEGKVDINLFGY